MKVEYFLDFEVDFRKQKQTNIQIAQKHRIKGEKKTKIIKFKGKIIEFK